MKTENIQSSENGCPTHKSSTGVLPLKNNSILERQTCKHPSIYDLII
jgi:hypothetical protein